VDIGYEAAGAGEDETPDWWFTCRPGGASEGGGADGRDTAVAAESCFETGNPSAAPEQRASRTAQVDHPVHDAVLSAEVLPGDRCGTCGRRLRVRPGVVDLQVKLTTLMGLDEHPALIPGFGVTLAQIARQIAVDPHTRPTWRWSIFDTDGELLHHGLTHHRPQPAAPKPPSETTKTDPTAQRWCTCPRLEPGERRGTIELQLTPATLAELIAEPDRAPAWRGLLTDIAAQVERDRIANPPGKWSQTDGYGNLLHHGHTGRRPDSVEAAFIRARDRSCRAPHCHVIASRSELDHRIEHTKGGPSHRGCVDCRCRRHHHLRDRTGFRVDKIGRTTIWTIPSGRTFPVSSDKDVILVRED
jgi:hypothetical protein